jgi:uncharacterized protein (TIGR02271 family)
MTLVSLKDTYPDYRDTFNDDSLSHLDDYSVYADDDNKVGSVEDGLFDDITGQFRYLIVDTGVWIFGKKVLLPIGKAEFDTNQRRVYVRGLTKEQVEKLPEYDRNKAIDYEHEESVRGVYREAPAAYNSSAGRDSVEQSIPVEGMAAAGMATAQTPAYTRDSYSYDEHDADLYSMPQEEDLNQPIRLYEERLIADKSRMKTGDVTISKRIDTETAEVSIPIEKERVVIERTAPTNMSAADATHAFKNGEVARVEVYEEQANVHKEAFVREEVNVRKETDQTLVTKKEEIRSEELEIDTGGVEDVVSR